jgi:hypothetical protein
MVTQYDHHLGEQVVDDVLCAFVHPDRTLIQLIKIKIKITVKIASNAFYFISQSLTPSALSLESK